MLHLTCWRDSVCAQDAAEAYLKSTNFITGLPFDEAEGESQRKETSYLQYAFLLLYLERKAAKVRKAPSWPRSWANSSLLWVYSHRNAWSNLQFLGQSNTCLAQA